MIHHNDFRIEISGREPAFSVTARTTAINPGVASESVTLTLSDAATDDPLRKIALGDTSVFLFKSFGELLFNRFFVGKIKDLYLRTVENAKATRKHGVQLSVQLMQGSESLYAIPWTLLRDPERDIYLGLHNNSLPTPFSHRISPLNEWRAHSSPGPARLLIVAASPSSLALIDCQEEVTEIGQILRTAAMQRQVKIDVLLTGSNRPPVTRNALARKLEAFQPQIVHFIGHGPTDRATAFAKPHLCLEHGDRTLDRCSSEILWNYLQACWSLRLIVLNACNSDGVAWKFAEQGVPAIGMRYKTYSRAAVPFSRVLYHQLATRLPLDIAANRARSAIFAAYNEDNPAWFAPVLFLPSTLNELVVLPPPERRPDPPPPPPRKFLVLAAVATLVLLPLFLLAGQHVRTLFARAPEGMVRIAGGDYQQGGENTLLINLIRKYSAQAADPESLIQEPPRTVFLGAFYIDRYEVTNRRYAEFLRALEQRHPRHFEEPVGKNHVPSMRERADFNQSDQPVVGVDWHDASAYCSHVGGRLPTGDEWERAARGVDGRLYPWGNVFDSSKTNAGEGEFEHPTPVGQFAAGTSPAGAYDLAGNVSEWTSEITTFKGQTAGIVRGGSWRVSGEIFGLAYFKQPAERTYRNNDVGFRCVHESDDRSARGSVTLVGAGEFRKGSEDSFTLNFARKFKLAGRTLKRLANQQPATVHLDEFYVDAFEVTNEQYQRFLDARPAGHAPCFDEERQAFPSGKSHQLDSKVSSDARFGGASQPVVGADWYDAMAYCAYAGKRLPTDTEWEAVARGSEGRRYPWGHDFDADRCNARDAASPAGKPAPVGSHSRCRTAEGVFDLVGNADEWTSTKAAADEGDQDDRRIRGGAWNEAGELRGLAYFPSIADARYRDVDMGFRCVTAPRRSWLEAILQ